MITKSMIEKRLEVLNSDIPPDIEKTCEKCAYLKGGGNF